SSPLTYSTFLRCDRFASACSSKVDLPMPGSPPINTTPPATSPPPSTRSHSSMPVPQRGTSSASISTRLSTGALRANPACCVEKRLPVASTMVSTTVFHCSQAGHCPLHLLLTPPHSVQV